MKFTIVCDVLLFILCYKLISNWEIPFHLEFDPFRVVGGFPTLIESFFDNLSEKPTEISKNVHLPLEDLQYPGVTAKTLNWTCPLLESSNQCFTLVTSSGCLASSQLSYSFWENQEESAECFHKTQGNVQCKTPFQNGNQCENVVVNIQRRGNISTFFELDDIMINTQIIQTHGKDIQSHDEIILSEKFGNSTEGYDLLEANHCQNYSIYETILIGGENDTDIFPFFPFGVNSTSMVQNMGCSSPFPSGAYVCNCRTTPYCQVPILYLTPNSTFCGSMTVSIYHTHGFIYSAVVTSSSESSIESQKHTVLFYDLPQNAPRSKFDLQRGRFQCPSETTCISELLYIFSYLDSLELSYQIGILVFSMIIGLVMLSNSNN